MKEIVIRYKTAREQVKEPGTFRYPGGLIQVLIDGKPIERLRSFSISLDVTDMNPLYQISQYMDYPDDPEYSDPII